MDEDDCDSSLTAILDGADDSDNSQHDDVDDNDDFDFDDTGEVDEANYHPKVPTILPRLRFSGARNVDTIKDGAYVCFS
jgi:WD repeat-containing protein 42A